MQQMAAIFDTFGPELGKIALELANQAPASCFTAGGLARGRKPANLLLQIAR
jgi:hypothetical protein